MTPVIALVGRPNVGKSTLFNRLTRSRDALVADFPGLTRDRKYGNGMLGNKAYTVIDTGGISGDEEGIDAAMAEQSLQAIDEADIVLFLVDARAGLNVADEAIANHLRVNQKKTWLVVNKTDGLEEHSAMADFWQLGLGDPRPIAAAHGRNVTALIDEVLSPFPERDMDIPADTGSKGIRIGVIGRPNVGKSTLVNRLLGEDRVVVFDEAGTTRDAIEIPFERRGKPYVLVDTAGVRRRKNVTEIAEKFSIIKTLDAIKECHVAIMVLDARSGLVEQDLHLLDYVLTSGRALVLAVNKWDGLESEAKDKMRAEIKRRLGFADYAELHFISALHGTAVGDLYPSLERAFASANSHWSTNRLTTLLQDAVEQHQPPMIHGRRIKLRMAHQGGSNPPIIVVHGNQTDKLPDAYKRYLTNTFRKVLKVRGTPMRFEFRSGKNPYDRMADASDKVKAKQRELGRTKEARKNRR
ncbi:ribosome biogenesis GTPase Der [Halomonas denitrificans]|uniref:ribosome biogenesis GTPase Der n=1 Tax=Halomonas TaxID=2745 RepID=UPI001A8C93C5|nr:MULTISPECIES: ribosome biogenesis GTPase Der [Halomonas]MED5294067.1 ribosome biogenesis GTPase Der [Pseudomonadota bacterium]MBN8412489.1 ribosome biogenesis GTPase Der [Halomonas litopenaei]MBY5924777.1 ribosome biogenesis GTPase Der [Halomonas sp. DP4Y7-2]MBY5929500.1 ribosome biogenesis GTPase Der [Halomonas sp. DP8Y7-3]MBY5968725.1 ribosome biogenesis GTPase Der [Halomonas denitrificans]